MDNTTRRPTRRTARRTTQRNDLSGVSAGKKNTVLATKNTINNVSKKKKHSLHHKMNVQTKSPLAVVILVVIIILVIGAILFGTTSLGGVIKEHNQQKEIQKTVDGLVDAEIDQIRATYSTVPTKQPAKENDVVAIKYTMEQGGQQAGSENTSKFVMNKESGIPVEIIEALIGKKINDKVSVDLNENSAQGGSVKYNMTVTGIFNLAELNDKLVQEFVKDTSSNLTGPEKEQLSDIKSVADLRKFIENNVTQYLNQVKETQQQQQQQQEQYQGGMDEQ